MGPDAAGAHQAGAHRSRANPQASPPSNTASTRPALTTCLFDLDGTLIDSIELIYTSYEHTFAAHALEPLSRDVLLCGLGTPLAAQFAQVARADASVEALIATYRAFNHEHHDRLVRPYAGALEALLELKARGLTLGIVTSKRSDSALRGLAACGIDAALFDTVVCLDDCTRHKPHPEPVLTALARLGVPAASAVYVGDSPHDAAAGRAAGVRVAAAGWGPFAREHFAGLELDWWLDAPAHIRRLA